MSQHYTKNTLSAAAHCNYCKTQTQHRVDDGRLGPCLECLDRRKPQAAAAPPAEQQNLFAAPAAAGSRETVRP